MQPAPLLKRIELTIICGADSVASPAITAVDRVEADQIRAIVKKEFDIALAGGGKITSK